MHKYHYKVLQIWLLGDRSTEEEQLKVRKGTLFIPHSQSPPKKYRKDCMYHFTPTMLIPPSLVNIYSCEVRNVRLNK